MFIDVHAHLSDVKYNNGGDVIASETLECEPRIIIDTASDRLTAENAFARAERFTGVYCAVGIHPEFADKLTDEDLNRFTEMALSPKTVAIGETGLDYHYPDNPEKEVQKKAFCRQIELADALCLPLVVHIRDAHGDALSVLKENRAKLKHGLLIHCYSGSKELLCEYDKLDAYYSFGGSVTFKNAKDKPEVIRSVRKERLLLETDCPYMSPEPLRGTVNYPKNVVLTAKKIAEYLEKDVSEIEKTTAENSLRLFGKIKV